MPFMKERVQDGRTVTEQARHHYDSWQVLDMTKNDPENKLKREITVGTFRWVQYAMVKTCWNVSSFISEAAKLGAW